MIGETLGGYQVLRRLGEGGMGEVYVARHRRISRRVAVKLLLPELSTNAGIVERFFNEARAASLIQHPGIVEVFDCDVHANGRAYIVMEFLNGESLGSCLARIGSFESDPRSAAAVTGQIASAIGAAHARGIIHRDLKPDNVFLVAPTAFEKTVRVKVLDFGIAKLAENGHSTSKTRTGSLLGTPLYMSPEQCRGAGTIDHRADVYSLGCIAYEMLTGRPPFVREGAGELFMAHLSEEPPPLSQYASVPGPLETLVLSMLAKDPSHRPSSMEAIVRALESMLSVSETAFSSLVVPPPGLPMTPPDEHADDRVEAPGITPRAKPVAPVVLAPHRLLAADVGGDTVPLLLPERRPGTEKSTTLSHTASERGDVPLQRSKLPRTMAMVTAGGAVALGLWLFTRPDGTNRSAAIVPIESTFHQNDGERRPGTVLVTPPLPENIRIDVKDLPPAATVRLDGTVVVLPVNVQRRAEPHVLTVDVPGFRPVDRKIDGDKDVSIDVELERIPPPSARKVKDHQLGSRKAGDRSSGSKRENRKGRTDRDALTDF